MIYDQRLDEDFRIAHENASGYESLRTNSCIPHLVWGRTVSSGAGEWIETVTLVQSPLALCPIYLDGKGNAIA